MSRYVLLDSGPLGMVAHPNKNKEKECKEWMASLLAAGILVRVPEIADYETRRAMLLTREQVRRQDQKYLGIERLDAVIQTCGLLPLTTDVIRFAAQMWADARVAGCPTADNKAIDADVLVCAQAKLLEAGGHSVEVATVDVDDLSRLGVVAKPWRQIMESTPAQSPSLFDNSTSD